MPRRLLVRSAYLFADFAGAAPLPQADAALLIEDGVVAATGRAALAAAGDAEVIGGERFVAIPGLVNAHSHGRGIDGSRLGLGDDWLEAWIPHYGALAPLDPYLDTLYATLPALRSGVTTTIHVAYPRPPLGTLESHREALRAHRDAGTRVAYVPNVQDRHALVYGETAAFVEEHAPESAALFVPEPDDAAAEYAAMMRALARDVVGEAKVRLLAGPEGPEWCSRALLASLPALMDELDIGLQTHVLESPVQRAFADANFSAGAVAYLGDLGLLGPRTSLAHGVWLDEADRALCAATGTAVVTNPSSNLRLRNGIAPVADLLEKGVPVGIGMDSTTLSGAEDMFEEIRLAYALHGQPRPEPWMPRPSQAALMDAATAAGARLAGFGGGTLHEGAPADIVLIDWAEVAKPVLAAHVPTAEAIVQHVSARHVDTVIVGGDVLVQGGTLLRHSLDAIGGELAALAAELPPQVAARQAAVARMDGAIRSDFKARHGAIRADPLVVPNVR